MPNGGYEYVTQERNIIQANLAPGVDIFADEAGMFHVLLRKKENDPIKKEYKDVDLIQSYNPLDFASMTASGFFKLYDAVEVLHDPTKVKRLDKTEFYKQVSTAEGTQADLERQLAEAKATIEKMASTPAGAAQLKENVLDAAAKTEQGQAALAEQQAANETALKKARTEYKKLYDVDADPAASLTDLQELIAMKKGK